MGWVPLPPPPDEGEELLRGGQGRDAADVASTGVVMILIACAGLALLASVALAVGLTLLLK